jgi:hypothetical protein
MSDPEMIPKARLDAEIEKHRATKEALATSQASIKGLAKERDGFKASAGTVESLTETIASLRADATKNAHRSEADLAMANAGLKKPGRQRFARSEYAAHREEAGTKAQSFGDWLEAQQADESTEIAGWLKPTAPTPTEPTTPEAKPPVRSEAGVLPTPPPPPQYAAGMFSAMAADPKQSLRDFVKTEAGRAFLKV